MEREAPTERLQAGLQKWEPWLPWIFVLAGLLLTVFPFGIPQLRLETTAVREIGVIFLIAGMATLAVERQRLKQYTSAITAVTNQRIDEIRRASIERILRGVMPEEFFALLSEVVLEQQFLRENQRFDITFVWHNAAKQYVRMYFAYEYTVTNLRLTPGDY